MDHRLGSPSSLRPIEHLEHSVARRVPFQHLSTIAHIVRSSFPPEFHRLLFKNAFSFASSSAARFLIGILLCGSWLLGHQRSIVDRRRLATSVPK
jgi:hypothetical protein